MSTDVTIEWPKRPARMDEHQWYREIEKTITLTVISADAQESKCDHCGQARIIYQCQVYPERSIESRCKACAIERAGGMKNIWVRTDEYLRKKWQRNGKDPAKCARGFAGRKAPEGVRSGV